MPASLAEKENVSPAQQKADSRKRPASDDSVFRRGPAKKPCRTDPLVGIGRHFGRSIRAFCRIQTLLKNGMARSLQIDLGRIEEEELSATELSEHHVFRQLLGMSPTLEERLVNGTDQELYYIADLLNKGSSSARADDTKSLKAAVVDWITPPNQVLSPPIARNVKTDRGFHHPKTGQLICPVNLDWDDEKIRRDLASGQLVPSGDLWPRFLFRAYDYDPENPWEGLFRSGILVKAFKHVFTSPSSVDGENATRATRSCNARIHGMHTVTVASIAYIATQVRFSLSSAAIFSRTDSVTDSEYFYNLVVDLLEDPEECEEVADLLKWWNMQVFPSFINEARAMHKDSVFSKIKEKRRKIQEALAEPQGGLSSPET